MKKRNSTLTVNLDAVRSNIRALQSYIGNGAQSMAVVKADAYGHGAVEVARAISNKVDWLAVNDVNEGIELREAGVKPPILVFGVPEVDTAHLYRKHNITATVSALEHFQLLPKDTEYHLNFDTGMSRLGFRPEQLQDVKQQVVHHPQLQCTGIYSHFATADEPESSKPNAQYNAFKKIRSQFDDRWLTHMSNTAGISQNTDFHFDMVRFGIGMYGYAPGNIAIPELRPAVAWHTRLVQVNPIKKGETVSYGARWKAAKDGYIGIIPVGYSDGIPRSLSGTMQVQIDGKSFSVAGTITMNYCMIDLGNSHLKVGTPVALWNKDITPTHWAKSLQTIPYEILTGIHDSIPRTYVPG